MKKMMLFTMTLWAFAPVAQAKVSDFNALINENISAQKELHQEVRGQMGETRSALEHGDHDSDIVMVETKGNDINVPTNKKFMRFKKEMVDHQASQRATDKRLANELKSTELSF